MFVEHNLADINNSYYYCWMRCENLDNLDTQHCVDPRTKIIRLYEHILHIYSMLLFVIRIADYTSQFLWHFSLRK